MNLQKQLADKLERVTWAGHYFYCLCPFHPDNSPSFLVYPDYCICKSCDKQGSLEWLNSQLSGTSLTPSKARKSKLLPKWKKWEQLHGGMDEVAIKAHQNVLQGSNGYFKKRKINQFSEQGKFGFLDRWALFPVLDRNNQVIDIVVRAIKQKNVHYVIRPYSEQEMRPLYVPNWGRVLENKYIYIVFGLITAWSLEAIGEPVVTGITGKAIKPELLDEFQKKLIVIPDYNEEKDGAKLVSNLGWRGKLKLIDWPNSCDDLDDVRVKHGNNKLKELLNDSN